MHFITVIDTKSKLKKNKFDILKTQGRDRLLIFQREYF